MFIILIFKVIPISLTFFFLKWVKHVDEQGRAYYYNADGTRSEWTLPNVSKQIQTQLYF